MTGTIPVVELQFADFLLHRRRRDLPQARQVALHARRQARRCRWSCALPTGVVGGAGAEHSQSLEAIAMHTPGLKVVAAGDPRRRQGPAEDRDPRPQPGALLRAQGAVPGEGRRCRPTRELPRPVRPGRASAARARDLTVVATGLMVGRALEAAERLAAEGIELEVIDPRTLVPLDMETIVGSVEKTAPRARRPRGGAHRRRRRRDRRPDPGSAPSSRSTRRSGASAAPTPRSRRTPSSSSS